MVKRPRHVESDRYSGGRSFGRHEQFVSAVEPRQTAWATSIRYNDTVRSDTVSVTRERQPSPSLSSAVAVADVYTERAPERVLRPTEIAHLKSWINSSVDEPSPVAAAGAAQKVADADLPMFRDRHASRMPEIPLVAPVMAAPSPSRKRRTFQLVDEMVRASNDSALLPALTSPSRVSRDKALLHQLLADCKTSHVGSMEERNGNQHSERRVSTADRVRHASTVDIALLIPDTVFFETNSFVGRVRVDLSDWACLCGPENPTIVDQIAARLTTQCEHLILRGLSGVTSPSALENLLEHGKHVRLLELSRWESVSKVGLAAITRRCLHVEELSLARTKALTDDILQVALSSFPRLTGLDVSGCPLLTDAAIVRIAKAPCFLASCRLDDCPQFSDQAILALVKARGPTLRVLSVRGLHRISAATVKELFVLHPKQLEELIVSGCRKLSDACFEFMSAIPSYYGMRVAPGYHRCVRFDMSDCVTLTSLVCCVVAASCPFLICFRAANCVHLCDKALRALASLSKLEELDLSGCPKLTDTCMREFLLYNGLQQKAGEKVPCIKPLRKLVIANCRGLGHATIEALVESAADPTSLNGSLLEVLDVSGIAEVSGSLLAKVVKFHVGICELYARKQRGVTRAMLARLATSNKVLKVLDIRDCPEVDDLALYPLAVMQSLVDFRVSGSLSGGGSLSAKGFVSLPSSLRRIMMVDFSADCLNDDGCKTLLHRARLGRLEALDVSHCVGISITGVAHFLSACNYLHTINVDGCNNITTPQLARVLRDDGLRDSSSAATAYSTPPHRSTRQDYYCIEVIDDPANHFHGLAAVDAETSQRARNREEALADYSKRRRAATSIQIRFRSRARAIFKMEQRQQHAWREYCATVDIQRVYRGYVCRRRYSFIRERTTRAVVYLQYKWRQKLQQRRIRKATSYWTNQAVLKTFGLWKHHHEILLQQREQARASQHAFKALHFWGEKTLGRVFSAWRAHVQTKTVKAKKAIGFWKCQSLPRVLEAWVEWTRKERRHRQLVVHVFLNVADLNAHNSSRQLANLAHANFKAKRVVVKRWRDFMVEQKRFLLKASLSILSGSLLHWSFRQWLQNVRQQRLLRDKHRRLVAKLVHRGLFRTWFTWRAFVHDQKAKKRAFMKFSSSMQAKCWIRWRSHHEEVLRLRSVSSRIAARLMQQQLARAVGTWFDFAQEQIDARQRQRRALAFFLNGSLMRTFTAWADYTAYLLAFRKRWKARHANASVHFTLSQWVVFTRIRRHLHACAMRLQAWWRGIAARRDVEDHYYQLVWATVLIQTAWRGRLARAILRVVSRKARLREYLRAEHERDAMEAEQMHMRRYNREVELVVTLQRMWRGVAARSLFIELRRARFILKKQQDAEMQEIVRAQARQRQLERIQHEKLRQLAATEIQRHARGYLARKFFKSKRELLHLQRCAARVQAVYRGRMSRRRTAALRRSFLTRMELLTRRALEGKMLRSLGAQTRGTQRPLRAFLSFFGLDPATFLTDVRDLLQEVRDDFQTLKQFFDAVRSRVLVNAKQRENGPVSSPSRFKTFLSKARPSSLGVLHKSDAARKFLRDFEQIVSTTAQEKEQTDRLVRPGDAVRIVLRGHARCGETAFVLGVQEEIAQVKLDLDGELEFFPLSIPATKMDSAKPVLQRVPDLTFNATSIGRTSRISPLWRAQLEAYAQSIAEDAKRFNAARVIQCAARVYLARMRVQGELELQGVQAARRQQAMLRVLQSFKLANTRIASVLVQLHFVRPLDQPPQGLADEPLEIQKIINRFQRFLVRRQEIHQAFMRLIPETYQGQGAFHGGTMPVPPVRLLDKLVHYPLHWMARVTRVPVARMLEKRGLFEIARLLGGAQFVKTFEEQHVDAREHCFEQLRGCGFCLSEGWALVHGVFQKRELLTDDSYAREKRMKKTNRKASRNVPHGWGVAHFLTGIAVGKKHKRSWLERNSIEAQFKSLELVKTMKQEERQERLTTQILARQGTLNTLRSAEGARGYAKRHAELSVLEEETQVFYARYQAEITLRQREEAVLWEEEKRVHAVLAKEKDELLAQGQRLHELQQQVPEAITDVQLMPSTKTPLEFLRVGGQFQVEFDDEMWYACEILSLDVYDTMVAEVLFIDDQRREKMKLIEASVLEDHKQFQAQHQRVKRPKTVGEITTAAAARAVAADIPFRRWRAGKAIEIKWEEPPSNGAVITQYNLEWRDDANDEIKGSSVITSNGMTASVPTTTTLWPIPEQSEKTLRVRVAAENSKGVGLASVYTPLPVEFLTEVSSRYAMPLIRLPPDTTAMEIGETERMEKEDVLSRAYVRELTCTVCEESLPSREDVYEHVARTHAVPLICPFKSCRQVCASERALRYHMWRSSIPKPTVEEQQSELFMEIFKLSRQYCKRKDRRHVGRLKHNGESPDDEITMSAATAEEMFLEAKYEAARTAWFQKAQAIHVRNLLANARDRERVERNKYVPPPPLYGLDFVEPALDVARREAVLGAIKVLQEDLDAFRLETTTQLDKLRHEQKELQDYISLKTKRLKTTEVEWQKQSLKRERKKAQKTLTQVEASLQTLITTSTQRIEEMTQEIHRLTVIEKAFVPFTHQVIRVNRLGTVLHSTHEKSQSILAHHNIILDSYQDDLRKLLQRAITEVADLDAWDAMIEARRRQLLNLQDELRRLQMLHQAEIESVRQKRDDGDERFQLTKLRQQQASVFKHRELAEQALLAMTKKQTRGAVARTKVELAAAEAAQVTTEIVTTRASLHIVNHNLQLHERFIKGKSADADYLKEENEKADGGDTSGGGASALLDVVAKSEWTSGAGGGRAEPPTGESTNEHSDGGGHGEEEGLDQEMVLTSKKNKTMKRRTLRELPHSYTRLECDFKDGMIRGHVRIEFNEGSVYEGPWVEDVSFDKRVDAEPFKTRHEPTHWGKFTSRYDGTVWQGEDVDNFFSPFTATGSHFQVTTAEGHEYTGDVRAGKFHGFGTLSMQFVFAKGEYVGEWCEGRRHGYGIERFDSGELYEGYWEMDLYHGHGEIVYDDGSRYEGYFKHGKWHGDGVRTLASGDTITGVFEEGFLNGPGVMTFTDTRHYTGEFRNTRRHGMGSLVFTNGDRYEGPFDNDVMHGEGKMAMKATGGGGGEPLVRLGKWEHGERTAWLSKPSTQLATATFIEYFAVVHNVSGELEMDLLPGKFKTPYAVMVAGMLPHLPEGVDNGDPFVQSIVRMLAKAQSVVIGAEILDKAVADHTLATRALETVREEYEVMRNTVDAVERETRTQSRKVSELEGELDDKRTKEQESQLKVETFWKSPRNHLLERDYKQAVTRLHACDVMDWYKLRTANLDAVYLSLLEAFAILLNFTTNFYLDGKMYRPSKQDLIMLLSSNEDNVHLGDKEGLIHRYSVKALYIVPLFDVYSFTEGVRNQMLHSITHVIHHPRLRPNNYRLYQISPAFAAVCTWVRAAFFYAKKAIEIGPTVTRSVEQLLVVEHLKSALDKEREALAAMQARADEARGRLQAKQGEVEDHEKKQRALAKVIEDIEALDAAESTPMEKTHIKKPNAFRPPSASLPKANTAGEEESDEEDALDEQTKKERAEAAAAAAAAAALVNRRQVFEEDHGDPLAQGERLKKEQVLARILEDSELAHELELLKKEVHKVLDRCGGKITMADFPTRFEEIMLKPLDPMLFGIKKMRTLLLLMDDVCAIVEPETEGDVESVQFPLEPIDDANGPMAPRQKCFCRLCPGVSYATPDELSYHEHTKWHYWNLVAKREGRPPIKFTLAATYWSEAYDSSDNAVCYYNAMTGEIVKGEPPLEMQANDLVMELLGDEPATSTGEETVVMEEDEEIRLDVDPWEEAADDTGNVYFFNRITGESSWTRPEIHAVDTPMTNFQEPPSQPLPFDQ